jgi:hypothetical protein
VGQSRSNPLSTQFDLRRLAGDLAAMDVKGGVIAEILPSIEWLDKNPPDADGNRPSCPPSQSDVRWSLAVHVTFQSSMVVPIEWPSGQAPCIELFREALGEVLVRVQLYNPELADNIRAVMAQGIEASEPTTETP